MDVSLFSHVRKAIDWLTSFLRTTKIDFVAFQWVNSLCMCRRFLVYNSCLISISISVFDQATNISFPNIKRSWHEYPFATSPVRYMLNTFPVIRCSKRKNLTKNVWAHWRFCHAEILHVLKADISYNITIKEIEISIFIYFHNLLESHKSICIQHNSFSKQSRMQMRQNVNNGVSVNQPK